MMFTTEQLRELRAADERRGWVAVPDGCPERILNNICEHRASVKARGETAVVVVPAKDAGADSLRERLAKLSL